MASRTFCPPYHELITKFLRPKIADDTIKCPFIHDADVYSAAPPELAARHAPARGTDRGDGTGAVYYFFCPAHRQKNASSGGGTRRQRAVGSANGEECGCWHPEGGEKAVLDADGHRVGHLRRLSYGVRERESRRRLTRLGWCMTEFGIDASANLVLCKLYRSPRARQTTTASSTASSKRKAADDLTEAPAASSRPHWMNHADMMPTGVIGDEGSSIHPPGQFHVKEEEQCAVPAPEEQTFVQTMDGPRPDHDVIMALAMGATVDDLVGPQQSQGEPGESSPWPAPEPCSISGGGDIAMAWPAPPAGEFSWDKEIAWIRELLSGSPRVPACDQNQLLYGC
ncbi:hypothetical protein E2562_020660 [Oryza meyeriana var. granulata]|uniref:NAC domain-containing protein n=1 Tax=Oryza meyeriana var. granulata TaxID=110450 RepID=A0A6G1EBY8_9ORYZ|nr:hypothetical protein E2562_020660 [Oryza meyeriana var. granulata]